MSPNTDEYWVGAFAMAVAIARSWLIQGRIDEALRHLDDVLERFSQSVICDPEFRLKLSEYWELNEERTTSNDDDRHVLRSLRRGD